MEYIYSQALCFVFSMIVIFFVSYTIGYKYGKYQQNELTQNTNSQIYYRLFQISENLQREIDNLDDDVLLEMRNS